MLGVRCRFPEARALSDSGIEFAATLPFPIGPFSLCYVLSMRASLEVMSGDLHVAESYTDRLLELAERHGFTFWTIVGGFYDAYRDLRAGVEGAGDRCQMSLMLMESVGVHVWAPYFHANVAAAYLEAGDPDTALPLLATGSGTAERTSAHYWSAELARLEGVARLATGDGSGLDRVRQAATLAAERGALLHELWALTTLAEHGEDDGVRSGLAALVDRVASGAPPLDVAAAREVLG